MLLLSFLFTVVSLLFIYALMRDTGKNTPSARLQSHKKQQNRQAPKASTTSAHLKNDSEVASIS